MQQKVQALLSTILVVFLSCKCVLSHGQEISDPGDQMGAPLVGMSNPEASTAVAGKVYTWRPTADSNWHNPRNWLDAAGVVGVPTELDDVIIPKGLSVKVTTPAFCKSLIFQSGICRLTATANLSIYGQLSIGSPISSSTSVSLAGYINCDSLLIETINGNNTLTVDGALTVLTKLRIAKANYANTASVTLTNTLNVNGTIAVGDSVLSEGDGTYRKTLIKFGGSGLLRVGGNYVTLKSYAETSMSNGGTLSIGGEWRHGNIANFTPGIGTVVYNRNGDQVVRGQLYYNLTLAGSGTKTTTGVTVRNKLSMQGTATASTLPIYETNASLEYKGSSPQVTGPELPVPFLNEVIVDNIYGILLNEKKNLRALSLVNGVVNTNGFNLTIGFENKAGVVQFGSPTAYVEGRLSRVFTVDGNFTFPIGKNGNYRPITIRFTKKTGVSGVAVVAAEQFETPLPAALPSNTALYTDRHWKLTQTGLKDSTFTYDISLNHTGFSFSGKPLVLHYDGKAVTPVDAEVSDTAFTAKALGSFSSFALGESSTATSVTVGSPEAIVYGTGSCTLTAMVTRAGGATPVNIGTVEFFVNNVRAGVSEPLANGMASLSFDPSSLGVGSYTIKAVYSGDGTMAGSTSDPAANGVLVIKKATAAVVFTNLEQVYDGGVKTVNIETVPEGLQGITLQYYQTNENNRVEVLPARVINAGSYEIEATLDNTNYELPGGSNKVSGVLVIRKAIAMLAFDAATMNPVYTGAALAAGATAAWTGTEVGTVSVNYTKDGVAVTDPIEAGTYRATATLVHENIEAAPVSADFVIGKAATKTTIAISDGAYTGMPQGGVARVSSASGLDQEVTITYTGTTAGGLLYNNTAPPTDAGTYTATAIYNGSDNYLRSEDAKPFTITPAPATITLADLNPVYDGNAKYATITVSPNEAGTSVKYYLSGNEVFAPVNAGSYVIEAVLANSNYKLVDEQGEDLAKKTGELIIGKASQAITISAPAPGDATYNSSFTVEAVASSGLPVSYSSTLPLMNTGNVFTMSSGIGTGVIKVVQEGNENYNPAPVVTLQVVAKKVVLGIQVKDNEFLYDGQPKSCGVEVIGISDLVEKPLVNLAYSGTTIEGSSYKSLTPPSDPGTYTVIATVADDDNFEVAPNAATFRIYAIPVVSLVPSNPLAINNNSVITAKKGYDVFDMEWHYSCPPEMTGGSELNGPGLTINSPTAGVYSVWVTFKDGLNNSYTAYTSEKVYAVFYDPAAGFVTGGGWINSPVEPGLLYMKSGGKATFGFVSKYEKGKNIPTGNTEFQFQAGGMNFKSSAYEWLVIAGSRAQYKGTGTINGAGNYGFLLTAVDGNLAGGTDADKFRIKIWDKNQGDLVVYDNQEGADVDAELTTALGGGSIVIHAPNSGRKNTTAISAEARAPEAVESTPLVLYVYPNPAVSSFHIQVVSANREDKIGLRVLDLYGRVVELIPNVVPGHTYSLGEGYRPGIFFVEVIQGSARRQVKLLKVTE